MKPLLVLIDLQNAYLAAEGLEPAAGSIVDHATRLLNFCRRHHIPAVHIRTAAGADSASEQPSKEFYRRPRPQLGSPEYRAPEALRELPHECLLHKSSHSGLHDPSARQQFRRYQANTLVVAGVYLHACVRQTVLDACHEGWQVWVAEDAVGSDDPLHSAITRRYLADRGVRFASVDEIQHCIARSSEPLCGGALMDDVDHVVGRAAQYALRWRSAPLANRLQLVEALIAQIAHDSAYLARTIAEEIGKPIVFCEAEVDRTRQMLRVLVERLAGGGDPDQWPGRAEVFLRRRPHGTVAVITPFNNPVYLPLGKIVPAVLYGNTVVWKPAPETGRISKRLIQLMHSAGWPRDLVGLLWGGRETGQALVNDGRVAAVTLTGSSQAGYSAQEACSRRRIPLQAELGGNNAALVWTDADLGSAAQKIAAGAFELAGQRCTANRRVIIHREQVDAFVGELDRATAAMVWGDPLQRETRVGPLASPQRCRRVTSDVQRAAESTAAVKYPLGQVPGSESSWNDCWFAPTIIRCDDPQHEIVQEETFGPVLVVQTAEDWQHGIELCNGVRQGLAAALFTRCADRIGEFLEQIRAGILKVNQSTADAAVDAPFGGWEASGIGPPEHGPFDLEFFTRPQTIYGNPCETMPP
jgi:acyl-CoA reductase-like NAD-dependent aldehyde dehydrogenase/nicotinamidase-related amidase